MKNIPILKGPMILTILFSGIILIASCGQNQKLEENNDLTEERNNAGNEEQNTVVMDNKDQEKDAQFLATAAEINLEEIQLGQLAQQNGSTAKVKELGKMMEDAHTKSLNELTTLAQSKMITIPNATTVNAQNAYKTLNEKTGKDFDKAYSDLMVNGHKDAIDTFEKASKDCDDADIRNWATASLPALRTHLDHSIDSQKKSSKM